MEQVVLGIDVGGTNIGFGLVTLAGKVLKYDHVPTHSEIPALEVFRPLFAQVQTWLNSEKLNLNAVGIGAPNTNYKTAMLENPPNLKWGSIHWPTLFRNFGSWPVFATGDAKAAALAEKKYGAGVGKEHFILLTLGTGLGGGIYTHNQLLTGHDGLAAEVGHVVIKPQGRLCGCGQFGCAETYLSATGLVKTFYELQSAKKQQSQASAITTPITAQEIAQKALAKDPVASECFAQTALDLAQYIFKLAVLFRPQTFILGGGLALSGDLLLVPTRQYLETSLGKWAPQYCKELEIVVSPLLQIKPGVLGAAALAWTENS